MARRVRLDLDYASRLWTQRRSVSALLRQTVEHVFEGPWIDNEDLPHPACRTIVIALRLTDDAQMRQLNADFRQKDQATNVLSFPSTEAEALMPDSFLGNIAIGYETVQREAVQDGKDFLDHLRHLLVHGCLHLIGYDHQQTTEAEEMEALEIKILAALGIANPYAAFELVERIGKGA